MTYRRFNSLHALNKIHFSLYWALFILIVFSNEAKARGTSSAWTAWTTLMALWNLLRRLLTPFVEWALKPRPFAEHLGQTADVHKGGTLPFGA